MALSQFTKDLSIIAALEDEPNDVGGLTAAELKAKFDEAGLSLAAFLNGTLIHELSAASAADSLGAALDGETTTVQQALLTIRQEARAAILGQLPPASVTAEKLAPGAVTEDALAAGTKALFAPAFTAGTEDLTAGESPLASGTLHLVYE